MGHYWWELTETPFTSIADALEKSPSVRQAWRKQRRPTTQPFRAKDIDMILDAQQHRCVYCPRPILRGYYHVDHRRPFARGGLYATGNIQFVCAPCNLSKGSKTHEEFLAYLARKQDAARWKQFTDR
jgi:5-methylcytosine-specific restriction endonuclease McrA